MTDSININALSTVQSVSSSAQFPVLTDSLNNIVNLVNKDNLAQSLISSTSNNLLTYDTNGLIVNNIIGSLSNLDTTTQANIVSAINELVTRINETNTPDINILATSGSIALQDGTVNVCVPASTVQFTLPAITDNTKFHQIFVQVKLTSASYLSGDNLGTSNFFSKKKPTFSPGMYNLIFEYDANNSVWVAGAISKGTV